MSVKRKLRIILHSTGIELNRIQHLCVLSNTQPVLGDLLAKLPSYIHNEIFHYMYIYIYI